MQGRPMGEAAPHGRNRMRALDPQELQPAQLVDHGLRHAVVRVGLALRRVPEVVRHKFQGEGDRRGPGQGLAHGRTAPSLEIAEVRGERPQRVRSHPGAGQVLEGGDVVVGEQGREALARIEGQNARQRIELALPVEEGVGHHGEFSGRTVTPSATAAARSFSSRVASGRAWSSARSR